MQKAHAIDTDGLRAGFGEIVVTRSASAPGTTRRPLRPAERFERQLLRATETQNPFAFVLEEQSYVRHLEGGAGRSGSFPW